MKICRKAILSVFIISSFAAGLNAQNTKNAISVPSSPAMPSVSVPSIGSGFYVPGSSGFYTGQKNVPAGSTADASSAQNADTTSNSGTQSTTPAQTSSPLTSVLTGSDTAQTLASLNDSLTAGDISSLNSLGFLGSFSNLLGTGSSASIPAGISGLQTSASSTAENALLQQILSELNELKKSAAGQTQKGTAAKTAAAGAQTPSILRFLINGTDMIPFCKTVFFSDTETDGSFLFTGDCHYAFNGTTRTETFYILFHANGAKNGMQTFTVTPSLSQQTEDKSTYLYKISTLENLTAQKTGNLITLKADQNGTTLNMLLSF